MYQSETITKSFFNKLLGRFVLVLITASLIWMTVLVWTTIGQTSLPRVDVVLINIHHGDSILIRSSKGETVLIDGGYPESGTLDYLKKHKITHIDTMITTHAHEDHIGGLPEVMRAIPVDKLIVNGDSINSSCFEDFENTAYELNIRKIVVRTGNRIPLWRIIL